MDRESCNEQPCRQWEFGTWSQCSVTCGRGIQRRDSRCVEISNVRQNHLKSMDIKYCNIRERITEKECILLSCSKWKAETWSDCSTSCGDGHQTRSVICIDVNERLLQDSKCERSDNIKPENYKSCNYGSCPQWKIGKWSEVILNKIYLTKLYKKLYF